MFISLVKRFCGEIFLCNVVQALKPQSPSCYSQKGVVSLLLHKLIFYYCELISLVMRFGGEIFVCNVVQALKDIPNSPSTVGYKHTAKRTVKIPCTTVEICTFICTAWENHSLRCRVVLGLYYSPRLDVLAPATMYSRVLV